MAVATISRTDSRAFLALASAVARLGRSRAEAVRSFLAVARVLASVVGVLVRSAGRRR